MKLGTYIQKFLKVLALNRDYVRFLGKAKLVYLVILALITSFLNSLNYVALIPLASYVIDSDNNSGLGGIAVLNTIKKIIPDNFGLAIYWLGGAIILTFFVKIILNVLFSHLTGLFGESYLFNIRLRMIKVSDRNCYERGVQSSSQVLHLNNMVPRIGTFNWSVFSLVSKLMSSAFLFASLMFISAKFAVFALVFVMVWALALLPILKVTREFAGSYTDVLRKIQSFLIEEIEAREIIKIFRLSDERNQRLQILSNEAIKSNVYLSDARAFVGNLQEFLIVITGVVILCVAKEYHLEIGYIVAYGYVFAKFLGNLNEASNYLNNALEVMPPTEEILSYVGETNADIKLPDSIQENIHSVEYMNLSFSWGENRLFDIPELLVKKGDRVLIKGKNGEGKSTLLKLMAGLIKAEGTLKVNEKTIMKLADLAQLHQRVSYLPQAAVVFDGMLWENIVLNSGKKIADIDTLIKKIGISLEEFFPDWKNYRVKESGKNLSGGEIQLIAFLRALVRDFDVIYIDEFANHLSQKLVSQFDHYLSGIQDKIIVCVSHAPVAFFNREYILDDGKLSLAGN
jgi:ABC-type bacteriocin/lantibiotic exporter with double-glycine peptidase domain